MKKFLRLILVFVILIDIMVGIWYLYNYFADRGNDVGNSNYDDVLKNDYYL